MRQIKRFKNDIAIDEYIVFSEINRVGFRIEYEWEDWIEIEPKYYIDKSDDMIYEIWCDRTGIILDRGLNIHIKNDEIATDWAIANLREINKESAMTRYKERLLREQVLAELDAKEEINVKETIDNEYEKAKNAFMNGQWIKPIRCESKPKGCNAEPIKQQNNGGSSDWYLLPDNAKTLQDLIEHRNMNGSVKDIFKACYRLGIKTEDELRDLNKTAYYALREIGRVTGRKDYITISKELIGSQAIEKE